MFIIFVDNFALGLWSTIIDKSLIDTAINESNANEKKITIAYYSVIKNAPEFYYFDENKNLVIQKKVILTTQIPVLDKNGYQAFDENQNPEYQKEEVVSFDDEFKIGATIFCGM